MLTQSKAGGLLSAGVALLAVALVGELVSQALLGQQESQLMANLPSLLLTVVSFIFSTAHLLGAAFIAAFFVVRALSSTSTPVEKATEPVD